MKTHHLLFLLGCFALQTAQPVLGSLKKEQFIELLQNAQETVSLDMTEEALEERYISYFVSSSFEEKYELVTTLEEHVGKEQAEPLMQKCIESLSLESRFAFVETLVKNKKRNWVTLGIESVKESNDLIRLLVKCAENGWSECVLP